MRLVSDMIEFCAAQVPQWNTVSISGYHIREAGSTAVQELAFTLRRRHPLRRHALSPAAWTIDAFAPRLSFFFNAHNDFFEEIAKYRAAREIWAQTHAGPLRAPASAALETAFSRADGGLFAHRQQPTTTWSASPTRPWRRCWAARNRCTPIRLDETYALPTEQAVTLALRTQQVLAYETGVTNTVDPLGGSYFVETLTKQVKEQAQEYFERIERKGGMIAALEAGFFRREIADAAFVYQREINTKHKLIVGVNAFQETDEKPMDTLVVDEHVEKEQVASLKKIKAQRDMAAVGKLLAEVRRVAGTTENLMPVLLEAVAGEVYCGPRLSTL